MNMHALASLLTANGYETLIRTDQWTECLVTRGGERWLGRGVSDEAALEDAVAQMLPSALARALARKEEETRSPRPSEPSQSKPPSKPLPEPAGAADTAEGRLAELAEEIERALPRFAVLAPNRQRLCLLAWICEARAVAESAPDDRALAGRVTRIAGRLTELAKTFWPGSVRALQSSAQPSDTVLPGGPAKPPPTTWKGAVQHLAERAGASEGESQLDADGWADAPRQRTPAATNPNAVLEQAVSTIEKVLGPRRDVAPSEFGAEHADALAGAARALRWIRGQVEQPTTWGAAMGWLRRVVLSVGDARLRLALDPTYRPPVPWETLVREHERSDSALPSKRGPKR